MHPTIRPSIPDAKALIRIRLLSDKRRLTDAQRRLTDAQRDRVVENFAIAIEGGRLIRWKWPAIGPEEAVSLAGEALVLAVPGHDPAKSKLKTYFYWWLRNVMRNRGYHNRPKGFRRGEPGAPSVSSLSRIDADRHARRIRVRRDRDLAEEIRAILARLGEDDRELLRLRFLEGWDAESLGFLAGEDEGETEQRIAEALKRARAEAERRGNLF